MSTFTRYGAPKHIALTGPEQLRRRWRWVTVPAHHTAIEYVDGERTRVLPAGRSPRRHRFRQTAYELIDMRGHLTTTAPQEVLTADGLTLRVTVAMSWRVADAVAFTESAADPVGFVYLAVQVALRELAGTTSGEEIARRTSVLDTRVLAEAAQVAAEPLGVTVDGVVLKDVVVPHELRAAATELAAARQRGAAQLEVARAETAAIRALANAGKLMDAHPALAQLRMVQSAPPGTQLVLSVGEAAGGLTERNG